jgi:hypothetical protein
MATAATLPPQPALLEREAEVAAIQELVAAVGGGAGPLLVIEGSAGMGKTRLVGVTRAAAQAAGLEVLAARAGELEQEFAFGVVRQLFEPLLARASAEERAELTAGAAGLALPLFQQPAAAGEEAADSSFCHAAWAVLAGREPGHAPAGAAGHRRPALGRRRVAAVDRLSRPAAGGAAAAGRRRHPAARAKPGAGAADRGAGRSRRGAGAAWPVGERGGGDAGP